jgi:KaiC/GvpD/RAD55 family RecA-like ATPase
MAQQLVRSGIAPLDDRMGGLLPGRAYVLSGAPGTGKSVACLEFLNAAIDEGGTAAILTHDDPTDLIAQAAFLGIELERALRDERFVLLRYQLDFARRFSRSPNPEVAFEELRRLLGGRVPSRIAIDSIGPFVEGSTASGAAIAAMLRFLDDLGATALLTYPGDLAGLYDRRLEPLFQRAAAMFHLASDGGRGGHIEVRKVRYTVPSTAPVSYRIAAGTGFAACTSEQQRRTSDMPEDTRRRVLVLDVTGSFPAEVLEVLRAHYDIAVRHKVASAFADLALSSTGAVMLDASRDTVDDALALVRELRRGGNRSPIIFVTQYRLRSADRARALRAGADDFLSTDMRPDEFALRVDAVVRRGRTSSSAVADVELPIVTQPEAGGRPVAFDEDGFRDAVDAHLRHDRVPFFTLVRLASRDGALDELAALAVESVRTDGGDLAGLLDGGVGIYLHSARRADVAPFVTRVRERWLRAGHGELEVETMVFPTDEERVRALVRREQGAGAGSR